MTISPSVASGIHRSKAQTVVDLTSYMMHKHYCENDIEALIALFDDEEFNWLGTGEQEYATGSARVKSIFRQFVGQVPKCNIYDEQYDTLKIAPDAYLCTGRLWIETDPSTDVYLRVHQRVSTIFRFVGEEAKCCHIHISNPYIEMTDEDVGFPTKIAKQTHDYMQQCIAEQKRQIEAQTAELNSIYNTVPCFIIRLLKTDKGCRLLTFNNALSELLGCTVEEVKGMDWSEGIAANVYKEDRERLSASIRRLEKPGDTSVVDYRLRSKDGKLIYLSCTNSLISEDAGGKIIQRIAFDISKRIELEHILTQMSFEDSLTGMLNRNRMNYDIKNNELDTEDELAVVCIDINGLKAINDTKGHIAGDELIKDTAAGITASFRGKAYRVGGDEFIVIEERASREELEREIGALLDRLRDKHINIAIGIACRHCGGDIESLVNEADQQMYKNKAEYYSRKENDRRRR